MLVLMLSGLMLRVSPQIVEVAVSKEEIEVLLFIMRYRTLSSRMKCSRTSSKRSQRRYMLLLILKMLQWTRGWNIWQNLHFECLTNQCKWVIKILPELLKVLLMVRFSVQLKENTRKGQHVKVYNPLKKCPIAKSPYHQLYNRNKKPEYFSTLTIK